MRSLRMLVVSMVALGAPVLSAQSWAAPCANGLVTATLAPCELKGGEVIFDITVNNLPTDSLITFTQNATSFRVVFAPGGIGGVTGDVTGNVTYTLTSTAFGQIVGVRLDSTGSDGALVTKSITPPGVLLSSLDGSTATMALNVGLFLTVVDTYDLGPQAALNSFANQFTIAEPVSVAAFGIGMIGLGLARRRRRTN